MNQLNEGAHKMKSAASLFVTVILLLGAGARISGRALVYPVDDAALRHHAGVEKETSEGAEAYASYGRPWPAPCPPEFPGS